MFLDARGGALHTQQPLATSAVCTMARDAGVFNVQVVQDKAVIVFV